MAVYNDDNELIGQRSLPVNALRPGFRHLPLRDKYNMPLPLSMLFVHIKVEDWVPDEMEGVCVVCGCGCGCEGVSECVCVCVCVCVSVFVWVWVYVEWSGWLYLLDHVWLHNLF